MPDEPAQRIPTETMRRVVHVRPQPSPQALVLHRPVFIAYLVCWGCALALLVWEPTAEAAWAWPEGVMWGWPAGMLFVVGALTSLIALARRLPVQNVVACGVVILALTAVFTTVGAKTGLPGYFDGYSKRMGPRLFSLMPWSVPFLWLVILFNSREVAKLILRPWRRDKQYGFWLIALAAALTAAMDFVLEPFAVRAQEWWSWRTSLLPLAAWMGVPWTSFMGWLVWGALILVFVGPWLTRRRPMHQHNDFHPLILWVSFSLLFAAGSALARLRTAALAGAAVSLLVACLAWRNSRGVPPRAAERPPGPPGPSDPRGQPRQAAASG